MPKNVSSSATEQPGIIVKQTDRSVAATTKQSAHLAGDVVVIDSQSARRAFELRSFRSIADRASTFLSILQLAVVIAGHAFAFKQAAVIYGGRFRSVSLSIFGCYFLVAGFACSLNAGSVSLADKEFGTRFQRFAATAPTFAGSPRGTAAPAAIVSDHVLLGLAFNRCPAITVRDLCLLSAAAGAKTCSVIHTVHYSAEKGT